jgi:hypothetical protein
MGSNIRFLFLFLEFPHEASHCFMRSVQKACPIKYKRVQVWVGD